LGHVSIQAVVGAADGFVVFRWRQPQLLCDDQAAINLVFQEGAKLGAEAMVGVDTLLDFLDGKVLLERVLRVPLQPSNTHATGTTERDGFGTGAFRLGHVFDVFVQHCRRDESVNVMPLVDQVVQARAQLELMLEDIRQDDKLDLRIVRVNEHLALAGHEAAANRQGVGIVRQ